MCSCETWVWGALSLISCRPVKLWQTDRRSWSWRLSSWRSNSATRSKKTSRKPAGNPLKQVRARGQRSNRRVTVGSQSHSGVCCWREEGALPISLSHVCACNTQCDQTLLWITDTKRYELFCDYYQFLSFVFFYKWSRPPKNPVFKSFLWLYYRRKQKKKHLKHFTLRSLS